jgi:hypothetical protein
MMLGLPLLEEIGREMTSATIGAAHSSQSA